MLRSLGLRSDVVVQRGVSLIESHPDRLVLRTPSEPDFWFGNMLIFRHGEVDPDAQIARFHADFPDAGHVTLAWDVPGMVPGAGHAELARRGFAIEAADVLTLTGPLRRHGTPEGITIRPVATDADWDQVIGLQIETGVEEGYDPGPHRSFVTARFCNRRHQIGVGGAVWLGAFEGDLLVGDLGVFLGDGVARYQSVETRARYRRRGICAALVTAGADWAAAEEPHAIPVIVADRDGAPGRIYRRCGLALAETLISAVKGSY
ncbi:MAG: GNAT family N-acetyltransferase [Roseicyclus sp.]|nr:GNAT family N-acetyltransferase [Roseicyclus sp.]MBO6623496.1 GNAT family N-acetyltransferase [Roseicyclus sp.]MBO6923839.1 GNAT family N-acetyltransferase [Roseicyclus sp.]